MSGLSRGLYAEPTESLKTPTPRTVTQSRENGHQPRIIGGTAQRPSYTAGRLAHAQDCPTTPTRADRGHPDSPAAQRFRRFLPGDPARRPDDPDPYQTVWYGRRHLAG